MSELLPQAAPQLEMILRVVLESGRAIMDLEIPARVAAPAGGGFSTASGVGLMVREAASW